MEWNYLAQERGRGTTLVKSVIYLMIPLKKENILTG
jgi:hypothetical protein